MTQAEMNSKAMADIFAIEDASPMFEAIGNSLDLGLDPIEDDSPKSFDDLLEVNPSDVPNESEMFMNEGDDLQDPETQKFVVDKFAEIAMSRSGGSISPAELDDVATVVHGFDIKGDVRSFLEKAMMDAKQKQQSQNVSDAQPEGTVAEFGEEGAEAAPADPGMGADVPAMEPMEPTAEPTLEPNAGEMDDLGPIDGDAALEPLPGDDGLGGEEPLPPEEDNLGGFGDEGGLDLGGEGADVGGDEGLGDEGGLDLGGDEGAEGGDDELGELDAGNLEGLEDLDDDSDEGGDTEGEDKSEGKSEGKSEDKSDDKSEEKSEDDDFNFESIAQKASSLMEGTGEVDQSTVEENFDQGQEEGTAVANDGTSEETPATPETPIEECGAATAAPVATDNLEECGTKDAVAEDNGTAPAEEPIMETKEAVCEAISTRYKMKKVADTVRSLIESYNRDQKLASTVARMESVISDFKESENDEVVEETKKDAQLESIIDNFAKASRENAEKVDMKKAFQATMESVQNAKKAILAKQEREQKIDAKLESIVASVASSVKTEAAKSETDVKLDSILESVKSAKKAAALEAAKKSEADKLQKELDAIVESVRNA